MNNHSSEFKSDLEPGSVIHFKDEYNFCDIPEFVTNIKTEIQDAETCTSIKQENSSIGSDQQYCSKYVSVSHSDIIMKTEDIKIECMRSKEIGQWDKEYENNLLQDQSSDPANTGKQKCPDRNTGPTYKNNNEVPMPIPADYTSDKDKSQTQIVGSKNEELKRHKCPHCDYRTKYKSGLNTHILCRHRSLDEIDIFKCNQCVYQSCDKYKVKRHLRIHQRPKEQDFFNCLHCDYRTIHKSALMKHVIRHKNVNEIETYKCLQCDYRTIIRSRLNRHSLRHKTFREDELFCCPDCDYKSVLKSSLKTHLLRHKSTKDIKMHKCPDCIYESRYKCALNRHVLVHKSHEEIKQSPGQCFRSGPVGYFSLTGFSENLEEY